ncbi:MAG: PAS domain S-box protein, partial [Rhodocyclaceae bacterium]|nr:PAS domain S-box protein [Rhodocyclaceae bacterium]
MNKLARRRSSARRNSGVALAAVLTRMIWLCVLPLALVSLYLAAESMIARQHDSDHEAGARAAEAALDVDQFVLARLGGLQMLAASPLLQVEGGLPQLYEQAQAYRQTFGIHVLLVDADLRMRFNTRLPYGAELPQLPRPSGRAAAPDALASGRSSIGDRVTGPLAKQPVVGIAVPVMRDGKPAYAVVGQLETQHLQTLLEQLRLPDGWSMRLLDGTGAVLAQLPPPAADATAAAGRVYRAKSEQSDWAIEVNVPASQFWAPVVKSMLPILSGIALAIWGSVIMGRRVARRLADSVSSLATPGAPGGDAAEVTEIAAVRSMLDEAASRRIAAERTLRLGEARFRGMFERLPVPLGIVDAAGNITDLNAEFTRVFGYTRAHLPSLAALWNRAFPDPACRAEVERRWVGASAGPSTPAGATPVLQYPFTCSDGKQRSVLISGITVGAETVVTFYDISERECAAAALRESESKYRLLADHATDWIFWVAPDGRCIYVSPACQAISGYGPAEFMADPALMPRIVADEDAAACLEFRAENGRTAGGEDEFRICRKDGLQRWVSLECCRVQGELGENLGWRGTLRDITERKLAAAALRENEERLRLATEAAKLGTWHWDLSDDRLVWSHTAKAIFGLPQDAELDYGRFIAAIHPEDRARVAALRERALAEPGDLEAEFRCLWPNGSVHWISLHGRLYPDGGGRPKRMEGVLRDVSAKVAAQERTRTLAEAVEQSPASIVITDRAGRIEYVNPGFEHNTGYSRAEAKGRKPRMLASGRTPPETYAQLRGTLACGKTWKGEFINRRKNGVEYIDFAVVSPIRAAGGDVTHYVSVQEDITEHRQSALELNALRHHLEQLVAERTADLQKAHRKLVETDFAMERVGLGIYRVDAASGSIVYANAPAADMLGYTVEQMRGMHVSELARNYPPREFDRVT